MDFYTQDSSTGVITPVASCDSDGCQSTMLSWFFQWAFCTAGATIVSGAVAERVKSPTYAVFAFLMASFIYPVIVAWTWGGGWIATVLDVGYMDFAGSGPLELFCGLTDRVYFLLIGIEPTHGDDLLFFIQIEGFSGIPRGPGSPCWSIRLSKLYHALSQINMEVVLSSFFRALHKASI